MYMKKQLEFSFLTPAISHAQKSLLSSDLPPKSVYRHRVRQKCS